MTEKNKNKIPSGYSKEDIENRLKWLKDISNFPYDTSLKDDPEELKGIIENNIGYMNIPMAIAGPLRPIFCSCLYA